MKSAFDRVRELGLVLPEVEESTYYGTPALKRRGKMLACMASHSSAEPNTLVVSLAMPERDELIDADPKTYYLKEHYVGYPSVLVRLSRIRDAALKDLLLMAWQFVGEASRSTRAARRVKRTRR